MNARSPSAFSVGDIVGTRWGEARILAVGEKVLVRFYERPPNRKTGQPQEDWLRYSELKKL